MRASNSREIRRQTRIIQIRTLVGKQTEKIDLNKLRQHIMSTYFVTRRLANEYMSAALNYTEGKENEHTR